MLFARSVKRIIIIYVNHSACLMAGALGSAEAASDGECPQYQHREVKSDINVRCKFKKLLGGGSGVYTSIDR